jgi:hypothetical protein
MFVAIGSESFKLIIFVAAIKLDLCGDTVVADAHVLPLTPAIFKKITDILAGLRTIAVMRECTKDSCDLFSQFIIASIERSRTWKHKTTCTAASRGEQQFLCQCGNGIVSDEFDSVGEWRLFKKYVTRCSSMSPLFSPRSSVESAPSNTKGPVQQSTGSQGVLCQACNKGEGVDGVINLMGCQACGAAKYCSRECQKKDWKSHKIVCRKTT